MAHSSEHTNSGEPDVSLSVGQHGINCQLFAVQSCDYCNSWLLGGNNFGHSLNHLKQIEIFLVHFFIIKLVKITDLYNVIL